jgi:hypothetical protein
VEGLESKIDHLAKGISGLKVEVAQIIEALNEVSRVQPTESASGDWQSELEEWIANEREYLANRKHGAGTVDLTLEPMFVLHRLSDWLADRSVPTNTGDGTPGNPVG